MKSTTCDDLWCTFCEGISLQYPADTDPILDYSWLYSILVPPPRSLIPTQPIRSSISWRSFSSQPRRAFRTFSLS